MSDLKSKLAIASGVSGLLLAAFMTVNDTATNLNLFSENSQDEKEEIIPISDENVANERNLQPPENN